MFGCSVDCGYLYPQSIPPTDPPQDDPCDQSWTDLGACLGSRASTCYTDCIWSNSTGIDVSGVDSCAELEAETCRAIAACSTACTGCEQEIANRVACINQCSDTFVGCARAPPQSSPEDLCDQSLNDLAACLGSKGPACYNDCIWSPSTGISVSIDASCDELEEEMCTVLDACSDACAGCEQEISDRIACISQCPDDFVGCATDPPEDLCDQSLTDLTTCLGSRGHACYNDCIWGASGK